MGMDELRGRTFAYLGRYILGERPQMSVEGAQLRISNYCVRIAKMNLCKPNVLIFLGTCSQSLLSQTCLISTHMLEAECRARKILPVAVGR